MLLLFIDDVIMYIEIPKQSIDNFLDVEMSI